jgi:hypothetical protein
MTEVHLSPYEAGYLSGLLKPHVEYLRLVAGSSKATPITKAKLEFVEALISKLNKPLSQRAENDKVTVT